MTATVAAPVHPAVAPQQVEAQTLVKRRRPWWVVALNTIPSLVVFSILGGVMYLGHHTGWKLPKMSALTGTASTAVDDWCAEHLVPESSCIECRTEILPKSKPKGFCREHGVAECVIHHPELAQVKGEPQLPKYNTVQAISVVARPENNSRNSMHTSRVQFSSAESVTKAGIDVDVVQERPMVDVITANGELMFDPTRVAHLSSRVSGNVAVVFKTVGDDVAAGDILALVDASQVGQAKSQFLQAVVQHQLRKNTVDRLRPIATNGALPQKALIEAESALQESEIGIIATRQALANLGIDLPEDLEGRDSKSLADDLRFLGLSKQALASLPAGTKTANLIPVRVPSDGVLVTSQVVAGEVVDASKALFTVSDPRRMWLILNVRQEDARYVRRGQTVWFRPDNINQDVTGQISWISPALDEQTRTMQVRVAIANDDGSLQDKTFGAGRIVLREEPNAIVVPRDAVQSTSDASFVFVRDKNYFDEGSPKFFHVRQVRLGAKDGQYVELLAGVLPGEVIVTKGSNVLLAQLLRGSLGAGCGCHND